MRAAPPHIKTIAQFVIQGVGLCSVAVCARVAYAQEPFTVETFEAGAADTSVLGVEESRTPNHLVPTASAVVHRSDRPVIFRAPDVTDAVDDRWTIDLGLSMGLFADGQVDARLPLVGGQDGVGIGGVLEGISAGDLRLRGKWRLLERNLDSPFGIAVQGAVYLPTGDRDGYTSDGAVRFEPRVIADTEIGPVILSANVGYQIRPRRDVNAFRHDDVFRWALAARLPVGQMFDVQGTIFGENSPFRASVDGEKLPNKFAHPVETLAGVGWNWRGFRAGLAGGAGLTRGVGAPSYRLMLSLGFTPVTADREHPDGRTVVAHDFDADGYFGDSDACPHSAETFDGFEDDDGCPDDDDDGDGIADVSDLCPLVPGLAAKSGCPSIDSDADGVDDSEDACPLEQGTAGGDGCPDPRESELWRSRFATMSAGDCDPHDHECTPSSKDVEQDYPDAIFFSPGQNNFTPKIHPLLERIAQEMQDDSTIISLIIEGHTDSRGDEDFNLKLSYDRAMTVRSVLMRRGIDATRLVVRGYGEGRPIDSNDSTMGRARNRRVAFRMVVRRRGREERIDDVLSTLESNPLPTLSLADFEFDRRMLVGYRPPRFVEGALLRAPQGWTCALGTDTPGEEIVLRTDRPPVIGGLRYPGWLSERRLTCREGRNIVAFIVEVEIPPFGVRDADPRGVQLTTRRPTMLELRFAGRAMPIGVELQGHDPELVAVSADVVRVRLNPRSDEVPNSARLTVDERVLLNVPLLEADDSISLDPIEPQRRFFEFGAGASVVATGRSVVHPGQVGGSSLAALRFTGRALATNWFALGATVDVASLLGPDPILFAPALGAESIVWLPSALFRPYASAGVSAFLPSLDGLRPMWDAALGVDYEPAAGAGLRGALRGVMLTRDGQVWVRPGVFLGAYTTF